MYEYHAKCTRVVDGDTIDCEIDLGFDIITRQRIRFAGINAPESRTRDLEEKKRGLLAKDRVIELLNNNNNNFIIHTEYDRKGKYGRIIGTIFLSSNGDNEKSESLNDLLVTEGHAVRKNYDD